MGAAVDDLDNREPAGATSSDRATDPENDPGEASNDCVATRSFAKLLVSLVTEHERALNNMFCRISEPSRAIEELTAATELVTALQAATFGNMSDIKVMPSGKRESRIGGGSDLSPVGVFGTANILATSYAPQALAARTEGATEAITNTLTAPPTLPDRANYNGEGMPLDRASRSIGPNESIAIEDDLAIFKQWTPFTKLVGTSTATAIGQNFVLHWKSKKLYYITKSQTFDAFSAVMIVSNAFLLGVVVNWKAVKTTVLPPAFNIMEKLFTLWFLVELVLRLLGHGADFFVGEDSMWNWFDLVVVASNVAEAGMDMFIPDSDKVSFNFIRLLRVLRITRAIRIFRLVRHFREFRMMVFSVLKSGTSLLSAISLLFVDIYIFGIFLTQNVTQYLKTLPEDHDSVHVDSLKKMFGSITIAMYTLFQAVAGGISWVEISDPLIEAHWTNALVLVFYIFFTIYALTNVITGIFVDTAIQSAQSDRDEVIQEFLYARTSAVSQMRDFFIEADQDRSGTVTFKEFETRLKDKNVRAHLSAMGIEVEEARGIFRLIDTDRSGSVTIDEFIMGCMRLKGAARSVDVATLMYENKRFFGQFATFFQYVEKEFRRLDEVLCIPFHDVVAPNVMKTSSVLRARSWEDSGAQLGRSVSRGVQL